MGTHAFLGLAFCSVTACPIGERCDEPTSTPPRPRPRRPPVARSSLNDDGHGRPARCTYSNGKALSRHHQTPRATPQLPILENEFATFVAHGCFIGPPFFVDRPTQTARGQAHICSTQE